MASLPLAALVAHLDTFLRIRDIPDEANAVNGLQVENSGRVDHLVAAVDASLATITAIRRDAGRRPTLLLVHHGLFWDGNVPVTERRYRRLKALLDGDIALYSAHLPLDVHPEVGNNAVLARQLGLESPGPFDTYRGISIGVQGRVNPAEPRNAFVERVGRLLRVSPRLIPGGPELVERVGIITGGAGGRIGAARDAGVDTYLTGEGAHHTFFDAMEWGINVVYAGHYATETVGIQALAADLAQRFSLSWEFHDHPTGL